jgi:hypothetical protein
MQRLLPWHGLSTLHTQILEPQRGCTRSTSKAGGQFIETTEATRRAGMAKKKVDAKKRKAS